MKTRIESYVEYMKTENALRKRGDKFVESKSGVIHFDKKGNVVSSWDRNTNIVSF